MLDIPRFSVLVPNYNHEKQISQALEALLSQSVQPRAIYIVDDASTDNSRAVIESYAARYDHVHATYLSENQGVIRTMNDWLREVDDEYVYFASADDIILPGFFEKNFKLLKEYPQADLVSSMTHLVDADGSILSTPNTPRPLYGAGYIPPEVVADKLYAADSWINGNTVIYKRQALLDVGGFEQTLEGFADGFVFRVLALMNGACFIDEPLAKRRWVETGYANRSIYSVDTALRIADNAKRLMNGAYAHVFPVGYAQRWEERWLYGSALGQFAGPTEEAYQNICKLLAPKTRLEETVIKVVLAVPVDGVRKFLAQIYLSVTLRPYDLVQAILRRTVFRLYYFLKNPTVS